MSLRFRITSLLLATASFVLAACGAAPSSSWAGLSTNGQYAFVAFNNQVTAVDLANGKPVWTFPPAGTSTTEQFFADPGVSDSVLVIGSEGPLNAFSGLLIGLDPATGGKKWCLAFDNNGAQRDSSCIKSPDFIQPIFLFFSPPIDTRIIGGIVVSDNVAYFGMANNKAYAVDALTGEVKWFYETEHPIWAAPVVDTEIVYIASLDHNIYALNRGTGELLWQKDLGASIASAPTLVDGTLYVGTFGNKIVALDARTSDEKWSATATNWVWGGPTVVDGVAYFGDLGGTLTAVNTADGSVKWAQKIGDVFRGSPALVNNQLFLGDKQGNYYTINATDGTSKSSKLNGQLLGSPLAVKAPSADEILILLTLYQGDNLVTAYNSEGAFKWAFTPSK